MSRSYRDRDSACFTHYPFITSSWLSLLDFVGKSLLIYCSNYPTRSTFAVNNHHIPVTWCNARFINYIRRHLLYLITCICRSSTFSYDKMPHEFISLNGGLTMINLSERRLKPYFSVREKSRIFRLERFPGMSPVGVFWYVHIKREIWPKIV